MSRIVYIGNFEPPHSTENEVLRALRSLGHDVEPRQEQEWASWINYHNEFDVLLWTRTKSLSDQVDEEVRLALLNFCTSEGIPSVGYHLDRWWGLRREAEIAHDPFFRVDLLCTADGGHVEEWEQAGVNHDWFPPAVSEFECGIGPELGNSDFDIAFVGSWEGYGHAEWWPQRARMLEHVRSWYGGRFRCFPAPGRPRVTGEALRMVYGTAKVVVGDSCLAPAKNGTRIQRYWSDRVPETLGRGGILVHPDVVGMECDMPVFTYPLGDMDELRERIDMLLAWTPSTTEKMRAHAVAYTLAHDTYTVRMRQLWERLGL